MPSTDYSILKDVPLPAIVKHPDPDLNTFHSTYSIHTSCKTNKPPETIQLQEQITPVFANYCQHSRSVIRISQVIPLMTYVSIFQRTEKTVQQLPKKCKIWEDNQIDLFFDIIYVGVVYGFANVLNFIRCFPSIFDNFWTEKYTTIPGLALMMILHICSGI